MERNAPGVKTPGPKRSPAAKPTARKAPAKKTKSVETSREAPISSITAVLDAPAASGVAAPSAKPRTTRKAGEPLADAPKTRGRRAKQAVEPAAHAHEPVATSAATTPSAAPDAAPGRSRSRTRKDAPAKPDATAHHAPAPVESDRTPGTNTPTAFASPADLLRQPALIERPHDDQPAQGRKPITPAGLKIASANDETEEPMSAEGADGGGGGEGEFNDAGERGGRRRRRGRRGRRGRGGNGAAPNGSDVKADDSVDAFPKLAGATSSQSAPRVSAPSRDARPDGRAPGGKTPPPPKLSGRQAPAARNGAPIDPTALDAEDFDVHYDDEYASLAPATPLIDLDDIVSLDEPDLDIVTPSVSPRKDVAKTGKDQPAADEAGGRSRRRGRRSGQPETTGKGADARGDAAARRATPGQARAESADDDDTSAEDEVFDRDGEGDPLRESRFSRADYIIEQPDVDDDDAVEKVGTRDMLINVSAGHECRIAVLHEGKLEELFMEREGTESLVGNIYKGRVTNVEPSIQAAFVDFGLPKQGFLHISDVQPQYFPNNRNEPEEVGRKTPRNQRPPIQNCLRRGQEVIVQITKDGVGTKGPTLTTYLSMPGRFLVMMPGMSKLGVSRKIESEDDRRALRSSLNQLSLPGGIGFIARTAAIGQTKKALQRDLDYLLRLWRTVADRVQKHPSPAELYRESDLVTRTIRDLYSSDFRKIVVDDEETARQAGEFLRIAMPLSKTNVETYSGRVPLFHHFGVEGEIERIHSRIVPLPSGGSLVIDSTEAMVAIDVNSGKFRADDAEETAYRTNIEAAEEIARQLRLRDLGGLIVCDFIDMRYERHRRQVERGLRDALMKHKERARVLRMSAFGLVELTRQRQGPSLKRSIFADCPHCRGTGFVKTPDSVVLDVIRVVQLASHHNSIARIELAVAPDTAIDILNRKRDVLFDIEQTTGKRIVIRADATLRRDEIRPMCEDSRGQPVGLATWHMPENDGRPGGGIKFFPRKG